MTALLEQGYRRCAELTKEYGTTYYWGAAILPPEQRRDVHAVYALCRLADDIVDEPDKVDLSVPLDGTPEQRLARFAEWFRQGLDRGTSDEPVMAAVIDTVRRRQIDPECFDRFFAAMTLDLTRTSWASWPELRDGYMEGSAAVIGEMMLPVLEPLTPDAREPARQLGLAFQLTNFIRDVGEDLDRGRIYLPADELARHGADPWLRRVTPQWRAALAEQIDRNRELYHAAEPGIAMLPPASSRCVATAHVLYSRILTRIEAADYDVFTERRRVPTWEKAATAGRIVVAGPPHFGTPSRFATEVARRVPIERLPQPAQPAMLSTWREARPARISRSLERALTRNPGGWFVVGTSGEIGATAVDRVVDGTEVVLWRTADGVLRAGPGACPHLGARLGGSTVDGERILCPWHGMALPDDAGAAWRCLAAHDDGVLAWVRLPGRSVPEEELTEKPVLGPRPELAASIAAVVAKVGVCEPRDVIANRLDPWHGAWFHPYAFSHLEVDEAASTDEKLVLDVAYRLNRRWGVPVRAEFTCPDARTITMEITSGEGAGSVVETHATPLGIGADGKPRSMVVEATIATSDRAGFQLARRASRVVRPLMRRSARQLWIDDLAYAERTWELRQR